MASNTPNLNLLKKDPATDGNDTFNIQTMLNDNWDKIDAAVGEVREELKDINVPDASLTQKGITQLSSATDSTAEDRAATPKAVKAAYDAATAAQSTANAANTGLSAHVNNTTLHMTAAERAAWNAAENNAKNASVPRATRLIGDLNSITEDGFYDGSSMANAPSTEWYYVEHMSHSQDPGNWRLQRATNFYNGVTYWRQLRAGTWTNWQIWGGGVKRITRYVTNLRSNTTNDYGQVTVTIPAVDVNKTSINLTGFYTKNHTADDTSPDRKTPAVYLSDATTIIVRTSSKIVTGTYGREIEVYFEVIEYN